MAQPATSNPYPGLRPFSTAESSLFFGREEQCDELLSRLCEQLPAPRGKTDAATRALIFDSIYDDYRGVISYVRVVDGAIGAQYLGALKTVLESPALLLI